MKIKINVVLINYLYNLLCIVRERKRERELSTMGN